MKLNDITGKKFGRLKVIKRMPNSKWNETRWLCQCDCGKQIVSTYGKLAYNHTTSCGCYSKELLIKNRTKHHLRKHKLYYIWSGAKQRCTNKKSKFFKDYGGRGIKVCEEWNNEENGFLNFYNWAIENGYTENGDYRQYTLDRIDVNGNYEPDNCRWVSQKIQNNNRRSNRIIEYNGEKHTITEWCQIKNITRSTFYHRIARGWSLEKTLITPQKNKGV